MPPVETTRPMSEEERALLEEPPPRLFGWWTGIVSAACGFALMFVVVVLAVVFFPSLSSETVLRVAIALSTLAAMAAYLWIQRRERTKLEHLEDLLAGEIAAGQVKSTTYTIRDAIAVEEAEDEGPGYYLLLDDGRTLFLAGQYLYDPVENGFPWTSFEVVRAVHGGWPLRVAPLGAPVTPSWTRHPFYDDEYGAGVVPADGTIEARDFDSLKRDRQ